MYATQTVCGSPHQGAAAGPSSLWSPLRLRWALYWCTHTYKHTEHTHTHKHSRKSVVQTQSGETRSVSSSVQKHEMKKKRWRREEEEEEKKATNKKKKLKNMPPVLIRQSHVAALKCLSSLAELSVSFF